MDELRYTFYEYKGRQYRVISLVQLKNPEDGEWVPAVQYQSYNDGNGQFYVRELEDFIRKFKGFKP